MSVERKALEGSELIGFQLLSDVDSKSFKKWETCWDRGMKSPDFTVHPKASSMYIALLLINTRLKLSFN